ncbi:hypothetical protein [Kribbella sp. NPDC048928]|uniref:hypothetical protein n=1 Tax=Kribbella sp. NPDC048928 TaxID=3364111 RepID=UPI0037127DF9
MVVDKGIGLALIARVVLVPPSRIKVHEEIDVRQMNVDAPGTAARTYARVEQDRLACCRMQ